MWMCEQLLYNRNIVVKYGICSTWSTGRSLVTVFFMCVTADVKSKSYCSCLFFKFKFMKFSPYHSTYRLTYSIYTRFVEYNEND